MKEKIASVLIQHQPGYYFNSIEKWTMCDCGAKLPCRFIGPDPDNEDEAMAIHQAEMIAEALSAEV